MIARLLFGLICTLGFGTAMAKEIRYIHTDALGSVVAITNASRGIIERREYEPYGKQLTSVVSDGPGYTGHVQDALTGLTYMQQRYYDSQLGVFLSVDPVTALTGSFNFFHRFRYANGNPYRFADPDGRASDDPKRQPRDRRSMASRPGLGSSRIGTININPGGSQRGDGGQDAQNGEAKRIADEVTKRGGFQGKGEADWIYQNNSDSGLVVTVDASNLTVTARGEWIVDPNGGLRAPANVEGAAYWTHGQGTVRLRPDGTYGLYDGRYNFELHLDFTIKGMARNIGTIIGQPGGGWSNTSYMIQYRGNVNITNPYQE